MDKKHNANEVVIQYLQAMEIREFEPPRRYKAFIT
jgi:hypothetical protein